MWFRTRWSGITREIIKNRGREFKAVQAKVRSLTDKYRIIGHTINTDLDALQIKPKNEIIDIRDLPELTNMYQAVVEQEIGNSKIGYELFIKFMTYIIDYLV